jgi:hypothetical protein
MIKTQIQIPDYLYKETKRISKEYEISLAEVVRRALEQAIAGYPPREVEKPWTLPLVDIPLHEDPFANENWREDIHMGGMVAEDGGDE